MKYYLWILGCAMNYSDAERIASVFDLAGYVPTKSEAEADVAIVVACSVRQTAIDRIYGKVKPWDKRRRKTEFKTILAGCVLPEDKKKLAKSFDLIFDMDDIQSLAEFIRGVIPTKVEESNITNRSLDLARDDKHQQGARLGRDYLSIVPKYESSFRAYVPIMTGCDNFCSYCAVPYTRGREQSRSAEDIISEVRDLVAKGYKEITLLGQNVNSYAVNKKSKIKNKKNEFVNLLKLIDGIPGDYRVYFYSNHPKDFSDELIEVLPKLKHFPEYIHLPLQSGSDEILRKMNRHYTQKDYLVLVSKIREVMPDVMLTTDILVGFPGETDADFKETMMVVREARFEMIFIGQYSPRPGTVSAKLKDDVTGEIKKKREKVITDYLRNYLVDHNLKFVGQTVRVLNDEQKGATFFGRTEGYKVVEITQNLKRKTQNSRYGNYSVGQFYDVKILEAKAWKLIATLS